jgi:hypothetical protein
MPVGSQWDWNTHPPLCISINDWISEAQSHPRGCPQQQASIPQKGSEPLSAERKEKEGPSREAGRVVRGLGFSSLRVSKAQV